MPVEELQWRWRSARLFVLVGGSLITAGGLVAAVSRPADWELGPWLAAFLVLVGGVGQVGLGVGQAVFARVPRGDHGRRQAMWWNLGVAGVSAGTLAAQPVGTSADSLALAVASVRFLRVAPRTVRKGSYLLYLHRATALVIAISIPVGTALAWARHG